MKHTFAFTVAQLKAFACLLVVLCTNAVYAQNVTENNVGADGTPFVCLDSLRPFTYEYVPDYSEDEVIARLGSIENRIKLNYNRQVLSFVDFFVNRNRQYSKMVLSRKNLYFPIFEDALARYGLPKELKYLAIVESGLKNTAKSGVGAVGLWQFMPSTGKMYDLNYGPIIDDRMDPVKSTEAACKYLKWLYNYFGDWELALASYNCGPGYVRNAIKKAGGVKSFWAIYDFLPQETRSYVPQFVAIAYMVNFSREHNLNPPTIEYAMDHDTILVDKKIDLKIFCDQFGVCYEDVKKLNPSVKTNIIPGNQKHYSLKIPADKASLVRNNKNAFFDLAKLEVELPKVKDSAIVDSGLAATEVKTEYKRIKVLHKIRKGQQLAGIAKLYGVSVKDIMKWNNFTGTKLTKGAHILVWREVPLNNVDNIASSSKKVNKSKKLKIHYVREGDTLWTISQKYGGVPVAKLRKINKIKGSNLKLGQKIIIG
jgi:membrane-bound lytic murein transglycosylase D